MHAEPGPASTGPEQDAIARALATGHAHHDAGRLREAEAAYRDALARDPDQPDALHLLGMIAYQAGRSDTAVELLNRAVALRPTQAQYQHDLGNVLQARGRLAEALACYRRAVALQPAHADAHFNAGTVLQQQGDLDAAAASYREALAHAPDFADAHTNLGTVLERAGQPDDAMAHYQKALALEPRSVPALYNLGNALRVQGRLDDAAARYRDVIALDPRHVMAHNNLGAALLAQGRCDEAAAAFRNALSQRADYMPAHYGLAQALEGRGRIEDALTRYRKALRHAPDHAGLRNDFGNALAKHGRVNEAIEQYRAALALQPDLAEAHNNLGNVQKASGEVAAAAASFRRALALHRAPQFEANLAQCLRALEGGGEIADADALLLEALTGRWARPDDLAGAVVRRIENDATLAPLLERTAGGHVAPAAVPGSDDLRPLAAHALLRALLERAPIVSARLERLLTLARCNVLERAVAAGEAHDETAIAFDCALARQCFINEYVFACSEEEAAGVRALQERAVAALAAGDTMPALALAALGAYAPLGALPGIDAALQKSWPAPVRALLRQQVEEPRQEQREAVQRLTDIRDPVSLDVQRQYEENPYPRWTAVARESAAGSIDAWLRARFPGAPFEALGKRRDLDILIAGCGTGREAIETAQRFPAARVLAIDLSRTSLAYAQRRSGEQGLCNVQYAQADIGEVGSLGRSFDVVSAVGVLHHLADPAAGLRALSSVLRPRGFMQIGLYSAAARRHVDAARRFVAEQRYAPVVADIRRCRQALRDADGGRRFAAVTASRDFYTTSECRDLLFHVQEHRFTLPRIRALLLELRLHLLGLVLDPAVLADYGARFPEDPGKTDLERWAAFETQFPDTFLGMYVLWVQKAA